MFTRCTFFFFFNNTLVQRATLGITQREREREREREGKVFACAVHAYQHIFARPHPPRPGAERERESFCMYGERERVFACTVQAHRHTFARTHTPRPDADRQTMRKYPKLS